MTETPPPKPRLSSKQQTQTANPNSKPKQRAVPPAPKDGNPPNVWEFGSPGAAQGTDLDMAISKDAFAQPATLAFTGCISSTAYSLHEFGLYPANSHFTGQPNSKENPVDWNNFAAFTTHWELTNILRMSTAIGGKQTQVEVAGAQPSNGNFCGDFRIEWHDNVADYYINSAKASSVYEIDLTLIPNTNPLQLKLQNAKQVQ